MRVIFAPDSFKGSVTAARAAAALSSGWQSERPDDDVVLMPMADGGEGTLDAFEVAFPNAVRHRVRASGPTGAPVDAHWLMLPDNTAVVELAAASGITLIDPLDPMNSSTFGFGQLIVAALEAGADQLFLALGGSATTDGGAGALTAMGARFVDAAGELIARGGAGLADLAALDLSGLIDLPIGGATILTDVENPLLGATGAAAIFGPQKGADAVQVTFLDANLARLADLLDADPTTPGAGAAGGAAFGLMAWGGVVSNGASSVGDALSLPAEIESADVVVTGEGRFDSSTGGGKAPAYVSDLARASETKALLVAGDISADTKAFAAAVSLTELAGSAESAIADAERWLVEAGRKLAEQLAP